MKNILKTIPVAAVALLSGFAASAATVQQNNTNAYTIDDPRTWANNEAPSAGNDYIASLTELKTVSASGVFAGNSLTLTGNGNLALKQSTGNVYTINNLILNGGRIKNTAGTNAVTLGGNIQLVSGSVNSFTASAANTGAIIVRSVISGEGSALINTYGLVNFEGSNSYSGGTVVERGGLVVQSANGLGTGNIDVRNGAFLTLRSATAMDSTALLILGEIAQVSLDFTGSSVIAGLSFDGGNSFVSAGSWGAIGSGAQFESSFIDGSGILTVIPESGTVSLAIAVAAFGACHFARRKFRAAK